MSRERLPRHHWRPELKSVAQGRSRLFEEPLAQARFDLVKSTKSRRMNKLLSHFPGCPERSRSAIHVKAAPTHQVRGQRGLRRASEPRLMIQLIRGCHFQRDPSKKRLSCIEALTERFIFLSDHRTRSAMKLAKGLASRSMLARSRAFK